jgi:hypothetical protein
MESRKFQVWFEDYGEGEMVELEADYHEDAAIKLCESRDNWEVHERVVCVREVFGEGGVREPEDEEDDPHAIMKFDAQAESNRYWTAQEHEEPPPETEESRQRRQEIVRQYEEQSLACRRALEQRNAVMSIAWIGVIVERATAAQDRMRALGFDEHQMATVFAAHSEIKKIEQYHALHRAT